MLFWEKTKRLGKIIILSLAILSVFFIAVFSLILLTGNLLNENRTGEPVSDTLMISYLQDHKIELELLALLPQDNLTVYDTRTLHNWPEGGSLREQLDSLLQSEGGHHLQSFYLSSDGVMVTFAGPSLWTYNLHQKALVFRRKTAPAIPKNLIINGDTNDLFSEKRVLTSKK